MNTPLKERRTTAQCFKHGIENTQPTSIGGDMTTKLKENLREDDPRPTISHGLGDPSCFQCFKTCPLAEDAIVDVIRSAKFISCGSSGGIFPARS
jgi:tyrosine aminotransferase